VRAAVRPDVDPPAVASEPADQPSGPAHLPMTHSVQVGAFLQAENARQLVSRLTARGVSAYILEARDAQGRSWTTVRIGDFPSRQAALSHAEEFARREQTKTLVRPFGLF
jgi:cell division septation protein DedD